MRLGLLISILIFFILKNIIRLPSKSIRDLIRCYVAETSIDNVRAEFWDGLTKKIYRDDFGRAVCS